MPDGPPAVSDPFVAALCRYLDASPSPFHAVAQAVDRLPGFRELDETSPWPSEPGRYMVRRAASLVVWHRSDQPNDAGFRIIGAHTDSPNLRIKPQPDTGRAGYRQLGVEVYGGALLNSWLDRDLGISARVAVRGPDGLVSRLVKADRPLLRLPQLAVHLDREVNEKGLVLNRQEHLSPVWGLGATDRNGFRTFLAHELSVEPSDVVAWDAMTHDLTPACVAGVDGSMLASGRIDNLLSCYAALHALVEVAERQPATLPVVCLFDHEEVGSVSAHGAGSSMLATVLERVVVQAGGGRDELHRALAASACVSADGAHATHPNYGDRHEPDHQIRLDGGPVVKINANERYATDSVSHARLVMAFEAADVPYQRFVNRADLACGSTIGPVTAAQLGISTVDAGVAQLAMHSARETAGAADPERFARALVEFLAGVA